MSWAKSGRSFAWPKRTCGARGESPVEDEYSPCMCKVVASLCSSPMEIANTLIVLVMSAVSIEARSANSASSARPARSSFKAAISPGQRPSSTSGREATHSAIF
jgi:hypothetical protein